MNAVSSANQIVQIIVGIIVISLCFILFPRKKSSKKKKKSFRKHKQFKAKSINLVMWVLVQG